MIRDLDSIGWQNTSTYRHIFFRPLLSVFRNWNLFSGWLSANGMSIRVSLSSVAVAGLLAGDPLRGAKSQTRAFAVWRGGAVHPLRCRFTRIYTPLGEHHNFNVFAPLLTGFFTTTGEKHFGGNTLVFYRATARSIPTLAN